MNKPIYFGVIITDTNNVWLVQVFKKQGELVASAVALFEAVEHANKVAAALNVLAGMVPCDGSFRIESANGGHWERLEEQS